MTLIRTIRVYLLTAIVFFAIDLLWLGVFAKEFYNRHLGHFLSDSVNWPAAMAFYAIYIAGIMVFVIIPSLDADKTLSKTALTGGFLGLFAYSTFDLTNYALVEGWPFTVVWVDMIWGTGLTAAVSLISVGLSRRIL